MAILTVTTIADSGMGSLRDALSRAAGTQTSISFHPALSGGTITLQGGALLAGPGTPTSTRFITIDGDIDDDGVADITLSGDRNGNGLADAGDSSLLEVRANTRLVIDGINFSGGYDAPQTGEPDGDAASAIRNAGNLTLQNSVISGGFAQGRDGTVGASPTAVSINGGDAAAVLNNASLTLIDARLEGNISHGGAGVDGTVVSDFGLLRRGSDGGAAAAVLNNSVASAENASFYHNEALKAAASQ